MNCQIFVYAVEHNIKSCKKTFSALDNQLESSNDFDH